VFKIAAVNPESRREADRLLEQILAETPSHWPYGLNADHFDGGLYLIREKSANKAVGFTGFQVRYEFPRSFGSKAASASPRMQRVGFYSIGILPEYRQNGFAKEAVAKLIAFKSASVDVVKAMIVAGNEPSMALARSLDVPVLVKNASVRGLKLESIFMWV